MRLLGIVLLLGLAPALGGCPATTEPAAYGYGGQVHYRAHPSSEGGGGGYWGGQPEIRPSNQWASHCTGGYDVCGRDGIERRQDGNPNPF